MFESLLVPLDGSRFGERALPYALALARATGVPIHLTHVHVPHPPDHLLAATQYQYEGVNMAEYDARDREEERKYLDGVANRVREQVPSEVRVALLEGELVCAIEAYAGEQRAGLVVMSTHGRTGASRIWLGSKADELVRHTHLPLVLVPPGHEIEEVEGQATLDHLLVALDGSPMAEKVLETALSIAKAMNARVTLLHVVSPHVTLGARVYPLPSGHLGDRMNKAREYLSTVVERLSDRALSVEPLVVEKAIPARAILDVARERDARLVAVATHGYRRMSRAILGSVADKVLRGSESPILVHRPE